jgi:hypothetical protein
VFWVPKQTAEVNNPGFGVCLWQMPDGTYIMDDHGNHLSAQGRPHDPKVEEKMRRAASSLGIENGRPFWLPGFRKVTQSEWEDQMDHLASGKIPDPVDQYLQVKND